MQKLPGLLHACITLFKGIVLLTFTQKYVQRMGALMKSHKHELEWDSVKHILYFYKGLTVLSN